MKLINQLKKTWVIVLVILSNIGISQEKPNFFGVRAGVSIPYGKYKSYDLEERSFAITGLNISSEGAWFFHPNIGVGASVGFNLHPINVSSLGWEVLQADPSMEDLTIRSEPYQIITAMGGIYTQIPIKEKFSFTGKLLGGLLYGKTPYQLYKADFFTAGMVYYELTSAQDWKFSWQAGAGFLYEISPCYGLVVDAEIMYDKLSFDFYTSDGTRTDVRTISFINTTFGVRFKL